MFSVEVEPLLLIEEFLWGGGGALDGLGDIRLIETTLDAEGGNGAGFIRCGGGGGGGGALDGGGGGNEFGGFRR